MDRIRRRSVAFLEREGETWACFLVTFLGQDRRWYGYFLSGPKTGNWSEDEVRTADIFREASEAEIDRKARGLGRPLLSGLLASALHTREREVGGSAEAQALVPDHARGELPGPGRGLALRARTGRSLT